MNSAYIKMQKEHAKRERRSELMAAAVGSVALIGGALVGHALFYTVTFLLLGA